MSEFVADKKECWVVKRQKATEKEPRMPVQLDKIRTFHTRKDPVSCFSIPLCCS